MRPKFFRSVALALMVLFLALPLAACCGAGAPTLTLRNPFQIDAEPASVAGPRLMATPTYSAPSWQPVQTYAPPGYYTPGPGAGVCAPQYAPAPSAGPCK